MSNFHEKAVECRNSQERHYNCAQATVVPFAHAAGVDEETAMRFAAGFGGGMKRASVCGAVTGGLMAFGLFGIDDPKTLGDYHRRIRENHEGFLECADLLKRNAEKGLPKKPHCDAMVYEVVDLVETILKEKGIKISE